MTNSKPSLQVVCPVFNEEQVIKLFYQSLLVVLTSLEERYIWSVIFVVDRSTDSSLDILRAMADKDKRIKVLGLSSRFGHQMSLVAGIDNADADAVVMMDSDLQHPPELIPKMLKAFEEGNEVVYTIRREPKDASLVKRLSSRSFYWVLTWIAEVPLSQGQADYRLISRRVAAVFKDNIRERNQFLRGLFSWVGFKRTGIEYDSTERTMGISKYNWPIMIRFARDGFVSFSKKPLQFAISIGLIFAFFGILFAIIVFIDYFLNNAVPSGWTTLSILISVFGGIQLFFLGVLGEYIGAIFDEVKARPLYLVEESINLD